MNAVIHLGFEVGTGKDVSIPLRHTVITGQSQEAGKTTTLEALIARARLPAVAFVTKRGERSFGDGRRIQPYFRERADWQFVASVLEATMRERLKFERAWIMRASKGARTLADVHNNVKKQLLTAKGLSGDVYLTLDAYLEIVVPRIAQVSFARTLDLSPGLNVLDLSNREVFPPELQSLVMRSALEWVYEKCNGTITIIPEAWEFIPQGRGSPVKLAAVELIRKGAGLANYVWLDSQDIGGVDKELLRSCPVWLLGVQREANEVKRVLDNIPAGIAKPRPADVAKLKKGQFYACFGDSVIKTYVQPAWMSDVQAVHIATGRATVEEAAQPVLQPQSRSEEEDMSIETDKKLDTLIELLTKQATAPVAAAHGPFPHLAAQIEAERENEMPASVSPIGDEDALYQRIKARLIKEAPSLIRVLNQTHGIDVREHRETIEVDGKSLRGRLALLILKGFFDQLTSANSAYDEFKRVGFSIAKSSVYSECDKLTTMGFLIKETGGYQAVASMKSSIKKAA